MRTAVNETSTYHGGGPHLNSTYPNVKSHLIKEMDALCACCYVILCIAGRMPLKP